MKQTRLCLLLPILFIACASKPAEEAPVVSAPEAAEEAPAVSVSAPEAPEPVSDSLMISEEMYNYTLAEVKVFVDGLNTMIRDKNYAKWKDSLSDVFFDRISSPDFLASASESPILKSKKIVLKTPQDYFINVVVPSRVQSQVDEIEFTAANRIKVYYLDRTKTTTTDTEPRRLRLYELVKDGDTWKIID
jgi:hypothetical protein